MLDRESIRNGTTLDLVREGQRLGLVDPVSTEERDASRRATLAAAPGPDVWVFGYGSLMWNPAFHFAEQRGGRIHGWHRRFCLWTPLGRGTPDNPGLMLGLDRGGACRGVAFRIAPEQVEEETTILWTREMPSSSYTPRWLPVATDAGIVHAIAFTVRRDHPRYAGDIDTDTMAKAIATASGRLGSCADYLRNTVAHMDTLSARDSAMHRLLARIEAICAGG
ncbi:MAG: gamma-glutamylcyclotransferase [Alphaproteobacteria bacterium]|nr:gamma-glutamylcyclotransferase [Alphaproteobacteria bacterium]